jgi:hypothetical protein
MKRKWIIIIVLGFSASLMGLVLWGPIVSNVEQPEYQIISSYDQIEIREYGSMIIAEVTTQGHRKEAISQGFRLLADYIFGNNTANGNIAMTAPVTQQQSQKIAMTAPVTQQAKGDKRTVHFIIPSEYALDKLPKPNNNEVVLKEVPAKIFTVIRFSGMNTNENIALHEKELQAYLSQNNLTGLSPPAYSFYNPPWTLSFLRRNEVMVEIERQN